MKKLISLLLTQCLCFVSFFVPATTTAAALPDLSGSALTLLRKRYVNSVLPAEPDQIEALKRLSARYAGALRVNGSWSDIDYGKAERSGWSVADHLNRALVMAKAARVYRNAGRPDVALEAKVIQSLQHWTDHDYRNPNWWWNDIGVPQLAGEVALLMLPQLPPEQASKVVAIMKRSNWRTWTGANLTWGVGIQTVRGCIEDDPKIVAEAYRRMYEEIKVVSPAEEGIQPDYSFHQHGAQLYSGGYGLAYANEVGRFIAFAWGTPFQISAEKMAIYSAYVLDGIQWMVRGNIIDYSTVGREITRQGKVVASADWTRGPISPVGAAYGLENVLLLMGAQPTPRQSEFQSFAARIRSQAAAPEFHGNKQFWSSDFMTHRRTAFYTSVKMLSSRMQNGELVNGEGKRSQHLSDGVNFLYRSGHEYKDIFPVWDWTKLPGTTAIQGTLETGEESAISTRGKYAFVGGVSDGSYGMAAMEFGRGKLTWKKSWFFFDDGFLCLGTAIRLEGDAEHSVATDVNQTRLAGDVLTSESEHAVPAGIHSYGTSEVDWVHHDDVGYVFGKGSRVSLSIGSQTGQWSDIGSGSERPITLPVFNLWIDHGYAPEDGAYQYIVLPGASVRQTAALAQKPAIHVLSNNRQIQGAWNDSTRLAMLAFYEPGTLLTPIGQISVDQACLLMVRNTAEGWSITAANPENKRLMVKVQIDSTVRTIELPDGDLAGSSVTALLRRN
ncbi:MAG TPA: polysaccharide lyase 8 family protein [Terriglobales bacterium]|nr:polysaccharide lyase 8 family protein [Terriglobales bacterium]